MVPDFTLGSIRTAIGPAIYYVNHGADRFLVVELDGAGTPEALRAMDALWRRLGHDRPLAYTFESASVERLYRDVIVQGFFFQAEDGIRDGTVTGVQTCALPI